MLIYSITPSTSISLSTASKPTTLTGLPSSTNVVLKSNPFLLAERSSTGGLSLISSTLTIIFTGVLVNCPSYTVMLIVRWPPSGSGRLAAENCKPRNAMVKMLADAGPVKVMILLLLLDILIVIG